MSKHLVQLAEGNSSWETQKDLTPLKGAELPDLLPNNNNNKKKNKRKNFFYKNSLSSLNKINLG